jgi:hypothetical protein
MEMESLTNSQSGLTPEQRNEIMKIGVEFAFEDGLTVENYKRQYPHVSEQEELAAFLEGYNKAKAELDADIVTDEIRHVK